MRVIVFGTGFIYEQSKHKLKDFDLVAFLDNDKTKQGCMIDKMIIDSPQNVNNYKFDAIFIMSLSYKEIRNQLIDLGVEKNKIVDLEHKGPFENCIIKHEYISTVDYLEKSRILLITRELTNTGAANVFFNMAVILRKQGFGIDLIALQKGPKLYDFIKKGINVSIYEWEDMVEDYIFDKYKLVILSSILVNGFATKLADKEIPVLWWLHEDEPLLSKFGITSDSIPIANNIYPLAVSERVKKAYIKYTKKTNIDKLCYGIEKFSSCERKASNNKKIICAVIGYVNEVKGQDILLDAIKINEENWKDCLEFWIIGTISEKDRKKFEKYQCIKIWGNVDHSRLMEMYSYIDIVLCTSRHESMSVAVVEGMMMKKLCIVSSETGNTEYCDSFNNSIVFESENIESLADSINWALDNQQKWEIIAENGYNVYLEYFQMSQFEKRIKEIVEEYIT